ncbi:MAG: DoxX family protein [Candidatus Acidiferrales bacterium]
MSPPRSGRAASLPIQFLQWVVGVVVLLASLRTFFHSAHKLTDSNSAHRWFLPVLSGVEILGAILFLIPSKSRIGSYLLLIVFGVALLFHLLQGDWEVGALVVYIAAVVVVRSSSGGF